MDDISYMVLRIVLAVAVTLVTYCLIPALRKYADNKDLNQVLSTVSEAVRAAEQTIRGSGMGAVKKDDVMKFVTSWLVSKKINITQDQLSTLVESAVWVMNNSQRE